MSKQPEQPLEGMALYCAVYDGPLCWNGRSAFEQIRHLEAALREIASCVERDGSRMDAPYKFAEFAKKTLES